MLARNRNCDRSRMVLDSDDRAVSQRCRMPPHPRHRLVSTDQMPLRHKLCSDSASMKSSLIPSASSMIRRQTTRTSDIVHTESPFVIVLDVSRLNDQSRSAALWQHVPMLRHVAEPFDAGGLHGGVGVQAFGDGVGDDGLAFLFQQFHQPPLLRHQLINLRRLAVEKRGDGVCSAIGGNGSYDVAEVRILAAAIVRSPFAEYRRMQDVDIDGVEEDSSRTLRSLSGIGRSTIRCADRKRDSA